MEDQNKVLELAKLRVKKKKGFYGHFAAYLACGAFFFGLNMATMGGKDDVWFMFPLLPWGIGILIHYFTVFGLPGTNILTPEWEEQELQKEMRQLLKEKQKSQATTKSLNAPKSEPLPDELDLNQPEKLKNPDWNEKDFV